jgi:hypothetical protein
VDQLVGLLVVDVEFVVELQGMLRQMELAVGEMRQQQHRFQHGAY